MQQVVCVRLMGKIAMLNDVYNAKILEYAGNIERIGRLEKPDASARAHSKLCGSTVIVDLVLRDGRVQDFAHEVKACALGQASSSIMARTIIGSTPDELRQLRNTMQSMLRENGPPPEGKFAEFRFLEPVRDYKARHASTLLTFDAVVDCLDQIDARNAGRAGKEDDKAARKKKVAAAASEALAGAGIRFNVR